jgi:hypothetical protein
MLHYILTVLLSPLLSMLPTFHILLQPVELVAAAHAPNGAAAAAAAAPHHHKDKGPLKAVLSPCLSVPAEPKEAFDTAAAAEQAGPEIQH